MQNTSHAVMAQRFEPKDSADDFPTPPWATRALIEHIIGTHNVEGMSCLEPAAGRGYMANPLNEYFVKVEAADAHPYGFCQVKDFLKYPYEAQSHDWVITNPPFRLAEQFVERARFVARRGFAILARTVFLESVGRYEGIFRSTPPTIFAQFSERVPMVKGRVDPKASTATGYGWFVWLQGKNHPSTELKWIPPCRKALERPGDYRNAQISSLPSLFPEM
ncbi:SAM-dependent methyltransferase [Rhizobium sp. FKY42]|uniref:SAM-dependent methyltransferase n=1 Tax=Rhizobium sp. FKY42 TaxID=2562310 RepID=UPI0010C157D1|nr:SAM-dependent methyltransferase [Rhizobium sp. FKY42]